MHDHAWWLVDDHEILVLVDNLESDGLSGDGRSVGLWNLELDNVAGRDALGRIGHFRVDGDEMALDQACRRRTAQVARMLGYETVEAGRGRFSDQAALVGLRNRYPATSSSTPMVTAESATLKTGQKWKLMKSVTPPPLMIRSKALPRAPPRIRPRTASARTSPGSRMT